MGLFMPQPKQTPIQRVLMMASLILCGEAIFSLPFHVTRFFRPTVLRAFKLSNIQLGSVQAAYGVLAMISYLFGGPLADKYPARKLLAASMVTTAIGGVYFSTMPQMAGLHVLWAYWGVSTILLFWAALIRATRDWGEDDEQGKAFGILDGGRGVVAAGLASVAVMLFGLFFPDDPAAATHADRVEALRKIIYGYSAATILVGLMVWFVVPEPRSPMRCGWRAPGTAWACFTFLLRSSFVFVLCGRVL